MAYVIYTGGRFVIQRTTGLSIKMGPFLDSGGNPLTGLTITVYVSKNDGDFTARNSGSAIADDPIAPGWYTVPLDGTDTGTQGNLIVYATATGALPVWRFGEVDNNSPA